MERSRRIGLADVAGAEHGPARALILARERISIRDEDSSFPKNRVVSG
jgi:hypothetical protein